jgi:hypothetical protein
MKTTEKKRGRKPFSEKVCPSCNILKPRKDFLASGKYVVPLCLPCWKIKQRAYDKHRIDTDPARKTRLRELANIQRLKLKEMLDTLKRQPCADCHGIFPPCCMDFDHRDPATKTANVANLLNQKSKTRLLIEVAKCDVVCSNCHRIRTAQHLMNRAIVGRSSPNY